MPSILIETMDDLYSNTTGTISLKFRLQNTFFSLEIGRTIYSFCGSNIFGEFIGEKSIPNNEKWFEDLYEEILKKLWYIINNK